ncbi:dirigent protein 22-like [Durio zibethinus]|uniref:Dirigent protein n=1 Tax=Durio zibethinus TaxID=66656 RepID=A0A6P6AMD8_DURZI|nr:dirigent protein 22-like [Durio zibethinus]
MASSMLTKHSSIFFLILFFTIISLSSLAIADHQSDSEVFSKYISPSFLGLKKEKLSHLHFYFHDIISGKNATTVRVAEAPSTNRSSTFFGATVMMDDPLTIKPDVNSKIVGRAQGIYAFASQSDFSLLMVLNFAFTEGKYNGSTLSVLGRNKVLSAVREMPVVGGSGVFRFARGYAQARTYTNTPIHTTVEYNVYVFHY